MAIEPPICNRALAAFAPGARADDAYVPEGQPEASAQAIAARLKAER